MKRRGQTDVHVLHVVPGLMPGGMELAMCRVVNALQGRGIRGSVACLRGEAVIADRLDPAVEVHCLRSPPNEPQLPWRLARLIRRLRPTVIHARNWGAWPDVAAGRLLLWPPTPLIFSFHGFGRTGPVPLRRRLAFRVLARMTPYLVTVSEAAREMMVAEYAWPKGRTVVIPNGVDTELFGPAPTRRRRSPAVIGSVGNLRAVKNHALLLRACAKLAAEGVALELRIAGAGPELASLSRLAESLQLADRVHFSGHVGDVPGFLRRLDVFVLSSDSENHPNALLEAMSCGLPCVATGVGGVGEVLDGGRCGRIVAPGDADAMARAVADILRDAPLRRRLAAAARQRARQRYGMERMIAAYADLYRRASAARPLPSLGPGAGSSASARSARPRVIMLGPTGPPTGGMAAVVSNLASSGLREACELLVINNGKTTPPGRPLLAGVAAQLKLLGRLVRAVGAARAEIVHIHTCASPVAFWRDCLHVAACRLLGRRVVLHAHDGSFCRFVAAQRSLRRCIMRMGFRAASVTLVLGRRYVSEMGPFLPGARWRVVPNGVRLPRRCRPPANEKANFLFLGSLTRRKGAFDLVRAAAAASANGFAGVVTMAGGQRLPGQRAELMQVIGQCPGRARIRLIGVVLGRKKSRALAAADCLVLPSYAEGLPMAVLEAMARGRPVIATNVGAIPEAITDGREGFLIEPGDVDALADRMVRLSRDAGLRRAMGRAARRRAEKAFSMEAMVSAIRGVYQELLGR